MNHFETLFDLSEQRARSAVRRLRERNNATARRLHTLQANGATQDQLKAIWDAYAELHYGLYRMECHRINRETWSAYAALNVAFEDLKSPCAAVRHL